VGELRELGVFRDNHRVGRLVRAFSLRIA